MASRKKKRRWITRIVILLAVVVAAGYTWSRLAPTLTAQSVTKYVPYTVESRDISTSMSFGGEVSILHSQAVSVSESTTVREVYVESSQAVSEGDKLIQLENGEVLTASIDGVINQLRAREGGWAIQGMTLVQVCDLTHMQISMSVDEYDISKLFIGQPCTVYILSLGMTFDAQIAHVNRVSTGTGSMAYYTAGIELTVPESVLPGMQASVTIPRDSATGVPALPVEAVSYDTDDQPFVYKLTGAEQYEAVPVALGLNDGMYVQLAEGLAAGDTAYVKETVEQAQEGFSLEKLYKAIFGETVVINESQQERGKGGADGGTLPEGVTLPEGAELPEGVTLPEGAALPEGAELPEGVTLPEGMTLPDSVTLPDGAAKPEDAAQPEGAGAAQPEGVTLPDGTAQPAGTAPARNSTDGETPSGAPSRQKEE